MQNLERRLEDLRSAWIAMRKATALAERVNAPRYNLMQLLGLDRLETVHSRFLCDLLDPYGRHGQGGVFLREFLEIIRRKSLTLQVPLDVDDTPAPGEWDVAVERAKIDITIQNSRHRFTVFIENKIDAGEQTDQLKRYRERLEHSGFLNRVLVFLTPKSYHEATSGKPDVHLTYEDDIETWLDRVRKDVKARNVRLVVDQYRAVIGGLDSPGRSGMESMAELLLRRENIECALEITDAMPEVEKRLCDRFRNAIAEALKNRLREHGLEHEWMICDDGWDKSPSEERGAYLASREPTQSKAQIVVGLWWKRSLRLRRVEVFHGIRFKEQQHQPISDVPELKTLCEETQQRGYASDNPEWWIAWKSNDNDSWNKFLVRVAGNVSDVTTAACADAINLLTWYGERIVTAQHALERALQGR